MVPPPSAHQPLSVSPPADPGRRRFRGLVLCGVLLISFALFTVGQALYLGANGISTQAKVVEERQSARSELVRVRFGTGHETELWAWDETPREGDTLTVVYLEERDWARAADAFAPMRRIWFGLGLGVWLLVVAFVERSWRRRGGGAPPDGSGGTDRVPA